MDTDHRHRSTRLAWLVDQTWEDEPAHDRPPLEMLLAFYAPRQTPRFVLGRANYRPPRDELRARLAVNSALMARGRHPRQSLPR